MEKGNRIDPLRIALVCMALMLLTLVYVFQHLNYFQGLNAILGGALPGTGAWVFVVNRTARLVVNDLLCMALVHGLFANKNYLRLAFYLFLVEILVVLPLYLWAKLHWEGTSEISSPLLSPIHRMVVNPLLMVLLIVALFYQQRAEKGKA